MGFQFRKPSSGGFLNGVAGVIVGYNFEAKEWTNKAGKDYTTLSVKLDILQDGADKAVPQFLQAGFIYDNQTISEDGQTLSSDDDNAIIGEDSEIARFLVSAVEAGLAEDAIQEDLRDLSGLVNQRFTFKREIDVEGTAKFGKKKSVSKKNGKEYSNDRDFLLVKEYHGVVEPAKKGAAKKATATAAAKPAAAAKKANGAAKNAEADALIDSATGVLLSILTDAPKNTVDRTSLSAKIMKYSTENPFSADAAEHTQLRESLRKLVTSEDFLNLEGRGWNYKADAKGQPVSLA
jgi:hypothetical protein